MLYVVETNANKEILVHQPGLNVLYRKKLQLPTIIYKSVTKVQSGTSKGDNHSLTDDKHSVFHVLDYTTKWHNEFEES